MGVILDTSVLIAIERNSLDIEKLVKGRENEPFGISPITAAELLHGVHRADSEKRRLKREAYVEKIIETFPIYPFDLGAARIYARIWAKLAKKGISIGAHDLMIASTAISLGFSVVTSDIRDYGKIKGLKVEQFSKTGSHLA
jgi:tRNA(fMet)-specific endonuclease VapC